MTVAPPLSRLHLVSALLSAAILCALFAFPASGKQPDKTPPGQAKKAAKAPGPAKAKTAPGQAKKSAPATNGAATKAAPGQAKKTAKAAGPAQAKTPPGQARKAARAQPPGQAKKQAPAAAGPPPGQATNAAGGSSKRAAARARRAARARAAARRRAATAARRRTLARRRGAAGARPARRVATGAAAATAVTAAAAANGTGGNGGDQARKKQQRPEREVRTTPPRDKLPRPFRVVRDIVHVVPTPLRILVAGLVALAILLAGAAGLTLLRNRRLARQQRELLGRVGLLQAALLPEVPALVGALAASVAYRPAEGPGAGGDFYDVLPLAGGQTAVVIGDVSGHGRDALARTALARYTLRAYVEAGMEPGEALQIAGSVLAGKLEGDFITALIAVHDAGAGTLTYASAGHPPPIVVSSVPFKPVLAGGAPPLGVGAAHRPAPDHARVPARLGRLLLHGRAVRGAHGERPARGRRRARAHRPRRSAGTPPARRSSTASRPPRAGSRTTRPRSLSPPRRAPRSSGRAWSASS